MTEHMTSTRATPAAATPAPGKLLPPSELARLWALSDPQLWILIFKGDVAGEVVPDDGRRRWWRWWRLFTRPGWRHVLALAAIGAAPDAQTVVVNPVAGRMLVTIDPRPLGEAVRDELAAGSWALAVPVPAGLAQAPVYRPIYTCAGVMAHLVGLRSWRVLTPRQLYRRLRREGARPILSAPTHGGVELKGEG
jgi:hypothetical protein